ncbi:protein VAC14 [Tanacetum coccineum]
MLTLTTQVHSEGLILSPGIAKCCGVRYPSEFAVKGSASGRGPLIICRLCVILDAERVYRELSTILEGEAATLVQALNLILLTSSELTVSYLQTGPGRNTCALMSTGRVFKTRLQRRGVKQSGEIDMEFKIVDEYTEEIEVEMVDDSGDVVAVVIMWRRWMWWRGGVGWGDDVVVRGDEDDDEGDEVVVVEMIIVMA